MTWSLRSWRNFVISQQPDYPDPKALKSVENALSLLPPLVSVNEIHALQNLLFRLHKTNEYFVINVGDCAEGFKEYNLKSVEQYLNALTNMARIVECGTDKKVILIGRFAGQFAKPRSHNNEKRGDIALPSYRGDMVNDMEFNASARIPKPHKLLEGYLHACRKMHYLHILYNKMQEISRRIFISHEALLLNYEESMTRKFDEKYYNLSTHLVWIGDRTRNVNNAHIEYVRGIENPIAIKVGSTMTVGELLQLLDKVNPHNEYGRVVLISRIGCNKVDGLLPELMQAVNRENRRAIWICDPMHGNTIKSGNLKIRKYKDIMSELEKFFCISQDMKVPHAGVQLEMSEKDISECDVDNVAKDSSYSQRCDPRLSVTQGVEIAHYLSEMMHRYH